MATPTTFVARARNATAPPGARSRVFDEMARGLAAPDNWGVATFTSNIARGLTFVARIR